MPRFRPLHFLFCTIQAFLCGPFSIPTIAKQPNIVWIIVEDMSANFGC